MPRPIQRLPSLVLFGAFARPRSSEDAVGGASVPAASRRQSLSGLTFSETSEQVKHIQLRPERASPGADATPCDYAANFHYAQNGDYEPTDVVFRLTSSGAGVSGCAVALETLSNYREIHIGLEKFTFSETRKAAEVRGKLPYDYMAQLTLRFWQGTVRPSMDDWIRLEVSIAREARTVLAGVITFYPGMMRDEHG